MPLTPDTRSPDSHVRPTNDREEPVVDADQKKLALRAINYGLYVLTARETNAFALNVLAHDQLDIGKAFFRSTSVEDGLINGYRFEAGTETGRRSFWTRRTGTPGRPPDGERLRSSVRSPERGARAYDTRR